MKSLAPYVKSEVIPMTSVIFVSRPEVSYSNCAKRPKGSVTLVIFSGSEFS
jgi:hypothetical protein